MIARTYCAERLGIDGFVVSVEATIGPGLRGLTVVGQVCGPLYESGLRVGAALGACGFALAPCKQLVNVAPAGLRKYAGMDLAIACALLVCHGVISAESLDGVLSWGELGPDGSVRPVVGTLIAADAASQHGFRRLVVACESAREAAIIATLDVVPVSSLRQLVAYLRGEASAVSAPRGVAVAPEREPVIGESALDLADLRDPVTRLALEVMVAGGHHLLVRGPAGSAKTISRSLPCLLPELDDADALVLTKLHHARSSTGWLRVPQIRRPPPTVSAVELLGGGTPPQPGEISLAHQGVLVLDDLPRFSQTCMDGLRRAIHEGAVTIGRVRFPARFRLLASAGPRLDLIPEPLLDAIDLVVPLFAGSRAEVASPILEGHRQERLAVARARQHDRLAGTAWRCNAEIPASGPVNAQLCPLTPAAERLLAELSWPGGLESREPRRIRRIARTIADLEIGREPAAPIDVDAVRLAARLRELSASSAVAFGHENSKRRQLKLLRAE